MPSSPHVCWPMAACPSPSRLLCLFPLYATGNQMRGSVTGMGTCSLHQLREQYSLCPWAGPHWFWMGNGCKWSREAVGHITDVITTGGTWCTGKASEGITWNYQIFGNVSLGQRSHFKGKVLFFESVARVAWLGLGFIFLLLFLYFVIKSFIFFV